MSTEVTAAQRLLALLPQRSLPRTALDEIDELESRADALHHASLGHLFSDPDGDVLEVIKSKDIIEALERAVNRIEKIGDTVEAIYVRRS